MVEWQEWKWWNDPFFELRIKIWTSLAQHRQADKVCEIYRGNQWRFPPKCIENTFQAIQNTFRSLEMHSKQRCKICICSFILGQLEFFRNYKRFSIIFPKILDAILRFTKVNIFFPDSFVHRILESENCRFPFSTKNSLLNLGSEMRKIKLKKFVGN